MPKITVNGEEVEFDPGMSVIEVDRARVFFETERYHAHHDAVDKLSAIRLGDKWSTNDLRPQMDRAGGRSNFDYFVCSERPTVPLPENPSALRKMFREGSQPEVGQRAYYVTRDTYPSVFQAKDLLEQQKERRRECIRHFFRTLGR